MYNNNSKIKLAIVVKNFEINGISTVVMNYAQKMDLNRFELTIFAGDKIDKMYQDKCEKLGIKIIKLPNKSNKIKYYYSLYKKIKKNYFDILHIHGNSSAMAIELFIGKMKKIKIRITHCHNTQKSNSFLKKIMKVVFNNLYTDAFACGDLAGKTLFEDKSFYIMRNGVDTLKYRYNVNIRNKIRSELNIDNKIVIGHVGRINEQKNQSFLIDVFEKLAIDNEQYILLLVGIGPLYDETKQRVSESKFKDRIILYGETNTPEKMYYAMDIFAFPSVYEGLPLTLVEAQISGLPCIISDKITDETKLSDRVIKLPITDSDIWKNKILSTNICNDRDKFYDLYIDKIKKFNIDECVNEIENKYESLI